MRRGVHAVLALSLGVAFVANVWAAQQTFTLTPGDSLHVTCMTELMGTVGHDAADLVCATLVPTATLVPPTPTVSTSPTPVAGQRCPSWVHDQYVVQAPDGQSYPTWHPPVDPTFQCWFGHEHGADPRTSAANATLPPFGYIGALDGMSEPHEGFKVFVTRAGLPGDNGPSPADIRVVFHMGTGGVGRYTTEFHSMIYDYVARDGSGRSQHLQGMADTGVPVGSTCDIPRKGGRDFSTLGCADTYEIWNFTFKVIHPSDPFTGVGEVRTTGSGAVAAFNPITTRDPADTTRLFYTEQVKGTSGADPLSPQAINRGCDREYYAQSFWNNGGSRPTVYWTDTRGHVNPAGQAPGLLRQDVSQTASATYPSFKTRQAFCDATTRAPN